MTAVNSRGFSRAQPPSEGSKNPKLGETPRFRLLRHRNLDIHFRVLHSTLLVGLIMGLGGL